VSGARVLGKMPLESGGLLVHIIVEDIAATIRAMEQSGCKIVQPLGEDAPEITAKFRDLGGNVFAIRMRRAKTTISFWHQTTPVAGHKMDLRQVRAAASQRSNYEYQVVESFGHLCQCGLRVCASRPMKM
jgi:hypothetical protein